MEPAELVGSLTERQHRLLMFVKTYIQQHGYSPTIRECVAGCGCKGVGNIQRMLNRLEDRGLISRDEATARGLNITPRGMAVREGEGDGTR